MAISGIDIAILILYLVGMVVMGVVIGRGQRDLSGYLLGSRDLPWWAILGSIVATETSTATFLSIPGVAFAAGGDFRFLQLTFGYLIGRVIVAYLLIPLYFRGEIFTAYHVLQERFGGASKNCASLLFLVTRNLGDGLRLFLAGLALERVLEMPLFACIIIIGIATILYTFFGGMKAVIWSDCLQFVVYMIGGVLSLLILIGLFPDGVSQLIEFGNQTGRWKLIEWGFAAENGSTFWPTLHRIWSEPYTLWSGLIGGAALTLGTHGTDQMFVQRYLAARDQRDATRAVVVSGVVVLLQFALFLLIGVALACYYEQVSPATFERNDQVFATFIVDHLPIGLVGVTLAAVFAAAMSTLSSSLNSSAAAAIADFYQPWLTRRKSEVTSGHLLSASRLMTIAFGILQIGIGIGASYISQSVVNDALAIAGFTAGILLGVFALGIFAKSSHQGGVLAAMVVGIGVLSFVKFSTSVAWPWLAIIGSVTVYSAGVIASRLIPPVEPGPPQSSLESSHSPETDSP